MRITLLVILAFMMPLLAMGQSKAELNQQAEAAFKEGNYTKARSSYILLFGDYADKNAQSMIAKCDKCNKLLEYALIAERDGKYEDAIKSYDEVLLINPADKKTQSRRSQCREMHSESLLNAINKLFDEGDYYSAKAKVSEYEKIYGSIDPQLATTITECGNWKRLSLVAKEAGNLNDAKTYLSKIISANPKDANSAKMLADINELIQGTNSVIKTETVYVSTPSKNSSKVSLRPTKNRCNLYVYSGFGNPTAFGGGIGFNLSYFQLAIDGAGCMNQEGVEKGMLKIEKEKNFEKLSDGTLVQGKMSIAITPGINLKYFGIGLGVGTMITKQYSNYETSSLGYYTDGTESNKSRLLLRPTLNGFIPFDKDFSCGMSIMAGYNMVSGVSGLNQFILGIGIFF